MRINGSLQFYLGLKGLKETYLQYTRDYCHSGFQGTRAFFSFLKKV